MGHCDLSCAIVQKQKNKNKNTSDEEKAGKTKQNQKTSKKKPADAGKMTEPNIVFGIRLQTSGENKSSNSGDSDKSNHRSEGDIY